MTIEEYCFKMREPWILFRVADELMKVIGIDEYMVLEKKYNCDNGLDLIQRLFTPEEIINLVRYR